MYFFDFYFPYLVYLLPYIANFLFGWLISFLGTYDCNIYSICVMVLHIWIKKQIPFFKVLCSLSFSIKRRCRFFSCPFIRYPLCQVVLEQALSWSIANQRNGSNSSNDADRERGRGFSRESNSCKSYVKSYNSWYMNYSSRLLECMQYLFRIKGMKGLEMMTGSRVWLVHHRYPALVNQHLV